MKTQLSLLAFAAFGFGAGYALTASSAETKAPFIERICKNDPGAQAREAKLANRLAEHLKLDDKQKAAFKDFQAARQKAVDDVKAKFCDHRPDLSTFKARLELHQQYVEDRLGAIKAENPLLLAFYNSLDAGQKAKFDALRHKMRGE